MKKETMEFQTPTVTRTEWKLSPVRRGSRKPLSQELTENDMLLLHLPEIPFVGEGERLNRSCPLDFDADSSDEEGDIEPFHDTWAPSGVAFLRPRIDSKESSHQSLFLASLSRMTEKGCKKGAFHQSFRLPKKALLPKISGNALKDIATEKRSSPLQKKPLRRQSSAVCA